MTSISWRTTAERNENVYVYQGGGLTITDKRRHYHFLSSSCQPTAPIRASAAEGMQGLSLRQKGNENVVVYTLSAYHIEKDEHDVYHVDNPNTVTDEKTHRAERHDKSYTDLSVL